LKPKDRKPLRPFRPGQYLTVQVKIPGQPEPAIRTYTLSDGPNESYFRLSIKREHEPGRPPGIVSNWFHDRFDVGDELLAKAPTGQFYLEPFDPVPLVGAGAAITPMIRILDGLIASRAYRQMKDARPVVLISAGVGITPMISMLNTLIADRFRGPVFFLHGTRNGSEHAFAGHVRSLARIHKNIKIHVAYSRPRSEDLLGKDYDRHGRIGIEVIQAVVPNPYGDFFLCGPSAFMKVVYEALAQWGVELERIHFEFFGPSTVAFGNTALPMGSKKASNLFLS
jgi:ferredoxin-NADP reductase